MTWATSSSVATREALKVNSTREPHVGGDAIRVSGMNPDGFRIPGRSKRLAVIFSYGHVHQNANPVRHSSNLDPALRLHPHCHRSGNEPVFRRRNGVGAGTTRIRHAAHDARWGDIRRAGG